MNTCHYCHEPVTDMRPYGPGRSWICAPCIIGDENRRRQAELIHDVATDEAGLVSDVGAVLITEKGVFPVVTQNVFTTRMN